MVNLERQLRDELLRDPKVKLLATVKWILPFQTIDVEFETVKRSKMDILMKMLLIAFRTSEFSSTEELSNLLVVEPLFIEDVLHRMSGAGMIVKSNGAFKLTEAGKRQLDAGIFIQPPEKEEATVYYSPTHGRFVTGEPFVEKWETYRYAEKDSAISTLKESEWREALAQLQITYIEGDSEKTIHAITAVNELEKGGTACLEFHLHQSADDRLYTRVWNTMAGEWDETLEAQITERELADWRKKYFKK